MTGTVTSEEFQVRQVRRRRALPSPCMLNLRAGSVVFDGEDITRMAPQERVRYMDANYYAARYCYQIERHYLRAPCSHPNRLSNEVRAFYRLPFDQKIHRIENPAARH